MTIPKSSNVKLIPCPFCGGDMCEPEMSKNYVNMVICDGCGALVNLDDWQRRPLEDALKAENQQLIYALEQMLNIFDREGTAPRLDGHSIGAMTCDNARAVLATSRRNNAG